MIKFAYVVPEDEAGFTKYIEVTLDSLRSAVLLYGVAKYFQNFSGQSELMLLVSFLTKSFPFGSTETQMSCTIIHGHRGLSGGYLPWKISES